MPAAGAQGLKRGRRHLVNRVTRQQLEGPSGLCLRRLSELELAERVRHLLAHTRLLVVRVRDFPPPDIGDETRTSRTRSVRPTTTASRRPTTANRTRTSDRHHAAGRAPRT